MSGAVAGEAGALHEPDAALLRAVLDAIPARVTIVGNDHRYLYANREFLEFTGRGAAEVVGQHVSDVLGREAYDELAPLRAKVQAGETVRRSGWLAYRDGEPRYVQQIFMPYRLGQGEVEGFLVFARDLTELKRREQDLAEQVAALEASEASNAAVIASSLDCIVVIDEAGTVVEFNPAAEATFGYARADAIGRSVADLIVPPNLRERFAAWRERTAASQPAAFPARRLELEAMRRTGQIIPVELTITELRLPERRLFAAHLRDLTEARNAQAEIERQRARLHQIEKLSAMGSLLAGVAHELNNPLAIVLAQSTLLAAKADSEDLKSRADKIHAAAARAGRIVKSFLAMARQKTPQREMVDVNEVIGAAIEMTAYGRRSAGIDLHLEHDRTAPRVLADPDMLGQVVANLLINATQVLSDAPDPRQVWVRSVGSAGVVAVTVADSGPGVPPEHAERIFEPYYTTKPVGAGTGIGLAISRSVVEAHGGKLTVGAREGGGALFTVTLPAGGEPDSSSPAAPAAAGTVGLSILVVDDEPDLAASLAEMLGALGHRATVAGSGAEALERARAGGFDALFADLRMPGLDGVGLGRALRETGAAHLVVVTGDTIAGPDSVAHGLGPETVILQKPFGLSDVEAALARAMRPGGPASLRPQSRGGRPASET